jgi:hypothetical protein
MIEEELNEIVESAKVTQKCHLPICAMTEFQTVHTPTLEVPTGFGHSTVGLICIFKSSSSR